MIRFIVLLLARFMGVKASKRPQPALGRAISPDVSIELLSNELIYEIFDYLSYHDIYTSFSHLNQRFDDLIATHLHSINLDQLSEDDPLPIPDHFRSLRISAQYQLPLINFSSITSIRALIVANIPAPKLFNILDSLPVEQLEYIYVGALPCYRNDYVEQVKLLQKKILHLGQSTLKRCVFRIKLAVPIDEIPLEFSALEYLRIDGCDDISVVNRLIDRMPNLKFLQVVILEKQSMNKLEEKHEKPNPNKGSLTHLVIHTYDLTRPDELLPIFYQHGSMIEKLVLHLNHKRETSIVPSRLDNAFANRTKWVMNIIPHYLPRLKQFSLRQPVFSDSFNSRNQRLLSKPFQEKIASVALGEPYYVSIPAHLAEIWQTSM